MSRDDLQWRFGEVFDLDRLTDACHFAESCRITRPKLDPRQFLTANEQASLANGFPAPGWVVLKHVRLHHHPLSFELGNAIRRNDEDARNVVMHRDFNKVNVVLLEAPGLTGFDQYLCLF